MNLELSDLRQLFCGCTTGGAKLARHHWIWTFIIWVIYSIISRGRHAETDLAEWYFPRLGYWV